MLQIILIIVAFFAIGGLLSLIISDDMFDHLKDFF